MNDKNFINFHILTSHSPSNLNRDDMGMQKSAIFGGVKRARISSQSLKRALRKSKYYEDNFGESSIRSKDLAQFFEKIKEKLQNQIEEKYIKKTIEFLSGKIAEKPDTDKETVESQKTSKQKKWEADAVAPWSIPEFKHCAKVIQNVCEENAGEKDGKKLKKKVEKTLKDKPEGLKKALGQTVDIAFFGRMTTSGIMESVDGALAVAHAITTHAVENEIDWFTAVDDLQERGAGHLLISS